MAAIPAITIHAAHPGNTDTRSQRQFRGRALDHFAHDLMARNELRPKRGQICFHDVQIGTTHSARDDPKQDMTSFKLWTRQILDMKK